MWDLSTLIVRTSLVVEEPSMVVVENTMAEKYVAWKG
jgi:hypothetical protein